MAPALQLKTPKSNLEKLGKTLSQRLLEHAELHAALIDADSSEQRRFADDLREAAETIERLSGSHGFGTNGIVGDDAWIGLGK